MVYLDRRVAGKQCVEEFKRIQIERRAETVRLAQYSIKANHPEARKFE